MSYKIYKEKKDPIHGVLFDMDGMVVEHYGASGG